MPLITSSYKAPMWIGGKHAQTIIPALFRKVAGVTYLRERIFTPDQDFIDIDWSPKGNERLAIISHGLEGSTKQAYVLGMSKRLNIEGWDILAWNFRSCSGEPNLVARLYHAGSTEDLHCVIQHALATKRYKEIILVGYSLGGNITLKYLGDYRETLPKEISRCIVFSVPCDLYACVQELSYGINRIYLNQFLSTLKAKFLYKAKLHPELFSGINFSRIRDLIDFDNSFTAPFCGFKDALHYYYECSSKKSIPHIRIPTLLVNAQNDPFLHPACFPIDECQKSRYVYLESPYDGGHQGFIKKYLHGDYWSEDRVCRFLAETK